MSRRVLAAAILCLLPTIAFGQATPAGKFTAGHLLSATGAAGTPYRDAGSATPGQATNYRGASELGLTGTGTPFCVNDGPTSGPYHQLCLGANSLGAGLISYNPYGGASNLGLNVNVNGSTYSIPISGSGAGNVVGPNSSVVGKVPAFNSTNGQIIADPATSMATLLINRSANFGTPDNFTGTTASAGLIEVLGSSGTPDTTQDPVAVFEKWANSTAASGENPAVYGAIIKSGNGTGTRATAGFFEADDFGGWNGVGSNSFVQGVKGVGALHAGVVLGSASGGVFASGDGSGSTHVDLIGAEGDVANRWLAATYTWNDGNPLHSNATRLETSFLATSSGTVSAFSAYLVNPFVSTAAAYQVGYFCPPPQTPGQLTPVAGACFRSDGHAVWGLDLTASDLTFGAIGLPNDKPIRAMKNDLSATLDIVHFSAQNELKLGLDAVSVKIGSGLALLTTATTGYPYIPMMPGAPTGVPAGGSAGYGAVVIDSTNHKLCYNDTSGWKCLLGS